DPAAAEPGADGVELVGDALPPVHRPLGEVAAEGGDGDVAVAERLREGGLGLEVGAERLQADVGAGGGEAEPIEEGADLRRRAVVVAGELDLPVADLGDPLHGALEVLL